MGIGGDDIFPKSVDPEDILPVDLIRWPGEEEDESDK
jgi:hypothetical protein